MIRREPICSATFYRTGIDIQIHIWLPEVAELVPNIANWLQPYHFRTLGGDIVYSFFFLLIAQKGDNEIDGCS